MRFCIVDLETTGTLPEQDQILQVGMIVVDTNKAPSTWDILDTYVQHDRYSGNAFALTLNHKILKALNKYENGNFDGTHQVVHNDNLASTIYCFLVDSGYKPGDDGKIEVVFAGKTISSFDIPFLKNVPEFNDKIKVHKRHLDPTILYTDFVNDRLPPSLEECKRRAGLEEFVSHHALEDCWDVAMLILHKMGWDFSNHIDRFLGSKLPTLITIFYGFPLKENKLLYCNDPLTEKTLSEFLGPFKRYSVVNEDGSEYYVWSIKEIEELI